MKNIILGSNHGAVGTLDYPYRALCLSNLTNNKHQYILLKKKFCGLNSIWGKAPIINICVKYSFRCLWIKLYLLSKRYFSFYCMQNNVFLVPIKKHEKIKFSFNFNMIIHISHRKIVKLFVMTFLWSVLTMPMHCFTPRITSRAN